MHSGKSDKHVRNMDRHALINSHPPERALFARPEIGVVATYACNAGMKCYSITTRSEDLSIES